MEFLAYAQVELGLGWDQLADMTPVYFRSLQLKRRERREREERTAWQIGAMVTTMVANTGFRGWPKPRELEEFVPGYLRGERKPAKRQRLDRRAIADRIREQMKAAAGAFGA